MDLYRRLSLLAVSLGIIAATLSHCELTASAHGDQLDHRLAQLYVSEAGWDGDTDHVAIYWAITNRAAARNLSRLEHLRDYSSGLWRPQGRAIWVAGLRYDGARDATWSATSVPWDGYADRWKATLDRARHHLRQPPTNPCNGKVEHWGGPYIHSDRGRALRAVQRGVWRPLDCGATHNAYFSVRRRSR